MEQSNPTRIYIILDEFKSEIHEKENPKIHYYIRRHNSHVLEGFLRKLNFFLSRVYANFIFCIPR